MHESTNVNSNSNTEGGKFSKWGTHLPTNCLFLLIEELQGNIFPIEEEV